MLCSTREDSPRFRAKFGKPSVAVTALTVLPDSSILAAFSSYLVNLDTSQQCKLFKHQAIHVFSDTPQGVLVCGGRSASAVDVSDGKFAVSVPETRLSDWVIAASWLGLSSDRAYAVLFSYNSVAVMNSALHVTYEVRCDSLCIVYGGCLRLEDQTLVCCSGTVFNTPLLWEPLSGGTVTQTFTGHQGVIFDTKLTALHLFSVSDDRTLVIWDRVSGSMLHRLYGHSARVLQVETLGERIVTVGEDNTCLVWEVESGKQVHEYRPHAGNGIRSVSCRDGEIVTGGWDGSVVRFTLKSTGSKHISCSLSTEAQPKWVVWLDYFLLVCTCDGKLNTHTPDLKISKPIEIEPRLQSMLKVYSKMCKVRNTIVIGGITGEIAVIDGALEVTTDSSLSSHGKVFSLTKVSSGTRSHVDQLELSPTLFLSCQTEGLLTLWTLEPELTPLNHFTLPKCKNRWVTSCLQTGDSMLVGDRRGGIHLYKMSGVSSSEEKLSSPSDPVHSIVGLHGENGISQIYCAESALLATVGRDGNVRFLRIEEETLVIVRKCRPLAGVFWIERVSFHSSHTEIQYFHGQHFKVSVLETHETLFSTECGGGHRSWDCINTGTDLQLAYINKEKVHTVSRALPDHSFRRYGASSHGAEIHSAVYCGDVMVTAGEDCSLIVHKDRSTAPKTHSPSSLLASGVPSSLLASGVPSSLLASGVPSTTVQGHISGIRTLSYCSQLNTMFSAGGKGALKAWRVCPDRCDLELLSDYNVVSETHLKVGYSSSCRFDQKNSDNDQRVLTVDCICSSEIGCLVLCGLSNGFVYLLQYSESESRFNKIYQEDQDNCITKVRILADSDSCLLISATTFGMVHCSTRNSQGGIVSRTSARLHSSGINGLDLLREGASCTIVTIGDDGDVVVASLDTLTPLARRTAHFSAGIAAAFLGDTGCIVTVGSDQRVVVLNMSLTPVNCWYSDVPDPHDMVLKKQENGRFTVLVCGKGFQEIYLEWD